MSVKFYANVLYMFFNVSWKFEQFLICIFNFRAHKSYKTCFVIFSLILNFIQKMLMWALPPKNSKSKSYLVA